MHRHSKSPTRGFTLIELLIVVAIIAILAAIAVPNFLEAQVRSKVSRAKADMRTLATAIESYIVDHNEYPDADQTVLAPPVKFATPHSRASLALLTTPVAYISNGRLKDPFTSGDPNDPNSIVFLGYGNFLNSSAAELGAVGVTLAPGQLEELQRHAWLVQSVGPDTFNFALSPPPAGFNPAVDDLTQETGYMLTFFYDPTNGTTSGGDLVRTGKGQLN